MSLCQIHGITSNAANIQQLNVDHTFDQDNCRSPTAPDDIKRIQHHQTQTGDSDRLSKNKASQVQCWLCDGPHSFRQCQELTRMKSVCAKRPQVKKHFRQLLLERNAPALKVLVDAPDFFDDTDDDISTLSENVADPEQDTIVHVNSIDALPHNTFTHFDNGETTTDVTSFSPVHYAHQIAVDHDDSYDPQSFHVLCINDDEDLISLDHPMMNYAETINTSDSSFIVPSPTFNSSDFIISTTSSTSTLDNDLVHENYRCPQESHVSLAYMVTRVTSYSRAHIRELYTVLVVVANLYPQMGYTLFNRGGIEVSTSVGYGMV